MRKLVTVRRVGNLSAIEGADFIQKAQVDGWECVVKAGEFQEGDLGVYFEIDSFLPESDERYSFLMNKGKKTFDGVSGHRLRTVKLKKQISQGLLLPVSQFPEIDAQQAYEEELDLSETLGIVKYEKQDNGGGRTAGSFPYFIPKTDEERVQNLYNKWSDKYRDEYFVPTLKLDGSSITAYGVSNPELFEDEESEHREVGVCSRKLRLDKTDTDNRFIVGFANENWEHIIQNALDDGLQIALQGELMGPGVQGNREDFSTYRIYLFNVFDITEQRYFTPSEFDKFVWDYNVRHVAPKIASPIKIFEYTLDEILKYSEGLSINDVEREGIVWKSLTESGLSFKSISNKFLLEGGD